MLGARPAVWRAGNVLVHKSSSVQVWGAGTRIAVCKCGGLAQELGLMVTSRWSALHSNGGLGGRELYFSTMWVWQQSTNFYFSAPAIHWGVERMFCPTWGWLCWWQGLWVWPSDTDHPMSSPHYIFHSLTSSDHGGAENMTQLFFILRFIFYWTIHCGFVIYANLTGSNKLWETSILFQSFKVNIDRLRKLKRNDFFFSFSYNIWSWCLHAVSIYFYGWMYFVLHIPSTSLTNLLICL